MKGYITFKRCTDNEIETSKVNNIKITNSKISGYLVKYDDCNRTINYYFSFKTERIIELTITEL